MCTSHRPLNGADSEDLELEPVCDFCGRQHHVSPEPTKRPVWLERLQAKDMTADVLSDPYRGSER